MNTCVVYKKDEVGVIATESDLVSSKNVRTGRPVQELYDIAATNYTTIAGSKNFLPKNDQREYLLIQNYSASDIWINFNREAGVNIGFKVFPNGGYLEWFEKVPIGSVNVFGTSSNLNFVLGEV